MRADVRPERRWLESQLCAEIDAEAGGIQQAERRIEELRREEAALTRHQEQRQQRIEVLQQDLNQLRQNGGPQ